MNSTRELNKQISKVRNIFKKIRWGVVINDKFYDDSIVNKNDKEELLNQIKKIKTPDQVLSTKFCTCLEAVITIQKILGGGEIYTHKEYNHAYLVWNDIAFDFPRSFTLRINNLNSSTNKVNMKDLKFVSSLKINERSEVFN